MLAGDGSNQEIADQLFLSLSTVKSVVGHIYRKLGVDNRRSAVNRAKELGLLEKDAPINVPKHNLPLQKTSFIAASLFAWLIIEDSTDFWVTILALAISGLLAFFAVIKIHPTGRRAWLAYPLAGLLAGLAAGPLAVFMMAIKTGLHGHLTPDFTLADVSIAFQKTLIWSAAGLLIGIGLAALQPAAMQQGK